MEHIWPPEGSMSHPLEIVVNSINLALSVVLFLQLLGLGRTFAKVTPDVLAARASFAGPRFVRAVGVLLVALVVFVVSNTFELYGDVLEIDWTVNEMIETVSLVLLIASLALLRAIFRLAQRPRDVPTLHEEDR
jgi:hypothetical protein